MLKNIKIDYEALEAMLVFWQMSRENAKVSEIYIAQVNQMPGFLGIYDDDFSFNSVRRVLSGISYREIFHGRNLAEGGFWTNNLWAMEYKEETLAMAQQIKLLNLDDFIGMECAFERVIIHFVPYHQGDYQVRENKLYLNFFAITPDGRVDEESFARKLTNRELATIDQDAGIPLKEFLRAKLQSIGKEVS